VASRNVQTFKGAHEAFNRRDFDSVVSVMAEDMAYRNHAQNVTFRGRDGFKQFLQGFVAAFSDIQVSEPAYIDAGEIVISQFINRGINDGPLGPLPATGRPLELSLCEIFRFNDNGQIMSGDLYYDQLSLLVQLGHAPAPEASSATV